MTFTADEVLKLVDEKGIDVFLPTVKKLRQWKDRKKWVTVPLFNNYLFVNIDYKERYPVLESKGVVRIITFMGKPVPIPDKQIEYLQIAIKEPEKIEVEELIPVGKPVLITSGPFKGIEGIISESRSNNVLIAIDSINKSVSITVHPGEIILLEQN